MFLAGFVGAEKWFRRPGFGQGQFSFNVVISLKYNTQAVIEERSLEGFLGWKDW
jgi:hypothetical protein